MGTPKEEAVPRALALVHAMQTLENEGLGTAIVFTRIRNRVTEILGDNPDIRELLDGYHQQTLTALNPLNDLRKAQSDEVESTKDVPQEIQYLLSQNENRLIAALFKADGNILSHEELIRAVYDEKVDKSVPYDENSACRRLVSLIYRARSKIHGWGKIHLRKGIGYYLEVFEK